jgi:hypothetical protein
VYERGRKKAENGFIHLPVWREEKSARRGGMKLEIARLSEWIKE